MDTRRKIRSRRPEPEKKAPRVIVAPVWMAVSRSVACFLGMTILLFLYGEIKHRGPDASIWWMHPLPIKPELVWAFLAMTGFELIGYFLLPKMSFLRRWITFILVLILFSAALKDSYEFYRLYKEKTFLTDFPIPFSLHIAASLTVVLPGIMISVDNQGSVFRNFFTVCITVVLCLITFPLSLMYCVGHVNHQQETTLAIIPGSTITSGKTSLHMIKQRVKMGHLLYQDNRVKKLCFASGQKIEDQAEAEIMKRFAIKLGIAPKDILIENQSETFRETIRATVKLIRDNNIETIMLVNNFESIARTKLYYEREGIHVLSTPVPNSEKTKLQIKTVQDEVLHILKFFFRPLE